MKISNSKVLIISHFLINPFLNYSAASTALRDFFKNKSKKVVQIELPFPESQEKYCYCLILENGKRGKSLKVKNISNPVFLGYMYHIIIINYFIFRSGLFFDLVISCDNLSFISTLYLKYTGVFKRTVFYSIDYVKERFKSSITNMIYHQFDKISCKNSDINWVVSKEQILARKRNGIDIENCSRFIVVPIGFKIENTKFSKMNPDNYYRLVFCGTLRSSAGPQLIVESLPLLLKRFPKIKVDFIGDGYLATELKDLTKLLNVNKAVKFWGRVENHRRVVKILTKANIGLAPYVSEKNSISEVSDPGKIKLYLSCGLPVITTRVATSWKLISRANAGIVIKQNPRDLEKAVRDILYTRKIYYEYKRNINKLVSYFNIEMILSEAIRDS